MALTVIVEDGTGKADANSYASVATADAYFASRPRSTAWTSPSAEAKARLLVHATRILDASVVWAGTALSTAQALAFPRYPDDLSSAELPRQIIEATCELAIILLARDVTAEADMAGFASIEVGPIKVQANSAAPRPATIPSFIRDLIAPYGSARSASLNARLIRA